MAEKKNPFEKLAGEGAASKAPAAKSTPKGKKPAAKASAPEKDSEEDEAKIIADAKKRVAAKKTEPAPEPEPEPEVEEEETDADTEDAEEVETEADDTPAVLAEDSESEKPAPVKKSTRRTAAQADAEAKEREEALQAQIDELKAQMGSKADAAEVGIVSDRVVLEADEAEAGGQLRVVGDGRTLVNDDWRATVDGLRVLVGRSSQQASSTLQIPLSLVKSLGVLLGQIDEVTI